MSCPTTNNHKRNCPFCVHYVCGKQFHTVTLKTLLYACDLNTISCFFSNWSQLSCELSRIHPVYLLQVLLPEMWGAFGRVPRGVACVTTSTTVCVLNTFQCLVDYCSILDVTRRVTRAYCLIIEEVMYHLSHIFDFCILLLRYNILTWRILKYIAM